MVGQWPGDIPTFNYTLNCLGGFVCWVPEKQSTQEVKFSETDLRRLSEFGHPLGIAIMGCKLSCRLV